MHKLVLFSCLIIYSQTKLKLLSIRRLHVFDILFILEFMIFHFKLRRLFGGRDKKGLTRLVPCPLKAAGPREKALHLRLYRSRNQRHQRRSHCFLKEEELEFTSILDRKKALWC